MVRITPISAKRELFSDFRKDFLENPVSGDLARKTNEESVKESIRNLVFTNRGERLFRPQIGGNIQNLLFEHVTPASIILVKEAIRDMIKNYEPRANLVGVDITSTVDGVAAAANVDNNTATITITFNMINSENNITLVQTISRVR